jgi:hypothetical protein
MNEIEREQRALCQRVKSEFFPSDEDKKVGLAIDTINQSPIYGARVAPTAETTGWYIWAGPHSEDSEFYQPVHASHLKELCPLILKYLGLAPGYKFIIDRNGYEDVWFERLQ